MRIFRYVLVLLLAGIILLAFPGFSTLKKLPANKKVITHIDCPIINYSNHTIVHPTCSQSNGGITGITVTSTGTKILYTWYDLSNNVVGHTLDLKNVSAGSYKLEVTDNSGCGTVVSTPYIEVQSSISIILDQTEVTITNASCKNDGAIKGISANGATSYQWVLVSTGAVVSTSTTTADLVNVATGNYELHALNSTCEVISKNYYVAPSIEVPRVGGSSVTDAQCDRGGDITVTLIIRVGSAPLRSYFTNSMGVHIYDGVILGDKPNQTIGTGGDAGVYYLYVEDKSNCSVLIGTYTINGGSIVVDVAHSDIFNDMCNEHHGAIQPIITGYTPSRSDIYTWTDATGKLVGSTKSITGLGAGTYKFEVDAGGACKGYATFTITNSSPALVPPLAKGTTICLPGVINIAISNTQKDDTYNLYASADATTPLESNATGIFYQHVDQTTDFYISRVHVDCESDRTKVTEVVVVSLKIPNAFTPNGDGINDYWNLTGIDKFPGADISIFTRDGQLIYHSINYAIPFNGTYHGKELPNGVYYYVIDVKQPICYGKLAGSLTIIR